MIDMMIILVFFLIFTAVFTKTNILELNLPGADSAVPDLPEGLNLEVIIRANKIEVADRGTGLLKSLPCSRATYDLKGLQDYLQLVKTKYSDKTRRDDPARAGHPVRHARQGDGHGARVPGPRLEVGRGGAVPGCLGGRRADMTPYRIKRHRKRGNSRSRAATT